MQKIILLPALFLFLSPLAFGQSRVVQVEQLSATLGAAPTVTFRVYWTTPPVGPRHLSNVWLFVDYLQVFDDGTFGAWTPATISGVVAVSDGTPSYPVALPYRGFYLQGNASGVFSSTVTVALAGLDNVKFSWCAYASDYPPNATEATGYYALHGAPPFTINTSVTEPSKTYTGGCITALTDATGCPGIPPAMPAVTSFIATPDTICAGDATTLAATATGAASYSFNGGAWTTDNAATFSPTTTTDYTIHIKNIAGCTATAAPTTVTVHPRPVATFVSPPAQGCCGDSITLTASGGGSYCFTQECVNCIRNPYATGNDSLGAGHCYSFVQPCTYTAASTYVFVMPDNGDVTVCVRVINEHGCLDSICTTVVNAGQASPPAPVLSGGGAFCDNTTMSCFGEAGYSYQLLTGGITPVGTALSGANALLTFPITASGAYTVKITDNQTGCTATSNPQVATVLQASVPSAPMQSGPTCSGTAITFTASVPAGATGLDWKGAFSGDGATKTTGTAANTYTAAVRSYTTGGGTTCYSGYTGDVSGTIVATPGTPGLVQNGPKCSGSAITFTASGGSGNYDWTGVFSGTGTTKTTGTGAGGYTAYVRSYTTASGTTCYSGYTGAVTGTIVATPGTPGLPTPGSVCQGNYLTFSASGGSGAYDWTGACSGQGNPKYAGTGAGGYTAYVRSYTTASGTTCYSGYTGAVTGTINGPGGNGGSSACGCASGLANCSGTCYPCCNCTLYSCSGVGNRYFRRIGAMTWPNANTSCQNLDGGAVGWRLPTQEELRCFLTQSGTPCTTTYWWWQSNVVCPTSIEPRYRAFNWNMNASTGVCQLGVNCGSNTEPYEVVCVKNQ